MFNPSIKTGCESGKEIASRHYVDTYQYIIKLILMPCFFLILLKVMQGSWLLYSTIILCLISNLNKIQD